MHTLPIVITGPRRSRILEPTYWRDVLAASDPGLVRLRMGTRALASAALSAALFSRLGALLHQPLTVWLIGVFVAMMATILGTDPTPRAQRITLLLMPLPACACVTLGTLLSSNPALAGLGFAAVIFASVVVRRFGPRGLALG